MDEKITNWTETLPKEFRNSGSKINKETMMSTLFRALIVAPSGAGKTNLVFDIIKRSPNIYSHLHICARNPDQPLYNYMKEKLGSFITIYESGFIPDCDQMEKDGLSLWIFDDYSNDQKIQKDKIVPFFIRGRHKGFSSIFLTHAYYSGTVKMIRLNVEYIMILKANSKKDLKMVLKDFTVTNCDEKTLLTCYHNATEKKGNFLMVDTLKEQLKYNFLRPINLMPEEKKLK